MKIEIKISDVKRTGKKVSVKETFGSLEDARAWINKCLFVKARQDLKIWMMRGMPDVNQIMSEWDELTKGVNK